MLETSARLLRLLSLLQSRRYWEGAALAERLEITPRTLRRDIDKLRSLGYTISAAAGPGGGYQLGQGSAVPPLLLDDDEAVAVAVSLRGAMDTIAGMSQTVIGVLTKLNQLLPARLRKRVSAIHAVTISVTGAAPALNLDTLTTLAAACRDHRQLTLRYEDRAGKVTTRIVEPLQLAHTGNRRWYVVVWDISREGWRTLRVDRVIGNPTSGASFNPRPAPADLARFVTDAISNAPYRYRAKFKLAGSVKEVSEQVPPWVGALEPLDATHSLLSTGAETPHGLIFQVLLCGVDFELLEPLELRPQLKAIAARIRRAAG